MRVGSCSVNVLYINCCCRFVVGTTLKLPSTVETTPVNDTEIDRNIGLAHYRCTKLYKSFALVKLHYQLFVTFYPDTPIFAMRGFTQHTMDTVLKTTLI